MNTLGAESLWQDVYSAFLEHCKAGLTLAGNHYSEPNRYRSEDEDQQGYS
jgi:hypothetical protein